MDPNPKTYPILSYVMSRLNSARFLASPKAASQQQHEHDIEQPEMRAPESPTVELVNRMPHLSDPAVFTAMKAAVAEVARTRTIMQALGDRPDHEAVDLARARLAEIDAALVRDLDDIARAAKPDDVDGDSWEATQIEGERACRAKADRERVPFRAVVQLEEMHEAYGNLLKEAEERLEKIYAGHDLRLGGGKGKEVALDGEGGSDGAVNEEVIAILKEAEVKNVEKVGLCDRQLKFLPEAFGRIKGLKSLDLSNNHLEVLPDSIAGLEHLEELRVASNFLVSLPDSIGMLLNLKILDASGNKLKALPDSISNCRSLVELDVSYNNLCFLPTNIGYELGNLQKLFVHLNKLRYLPTSICEMRSLRLLDAHFNELRGLPHAFGKLNHLQSLNLSSNFSDLKELPPSFGDLMNLRELDLSNNQLHSLPDTFGRLENLIKLNLDQNPLAVPPEEVVKQGVVAVRDYMAKRWLDILIQEQKNKVQEETPAATGWLTRSTSKLSSLVTGVSEYLGVGDKSPRDPYLDQEL